MFTRMNLRAALLLLSLSLGCSGASRLTLDDVASLFHDDVRWGRLPAAQGAVAAAMQTEFVRHHRTWGSLVHIMDIEVEQMRATPATGTIRLRVVWTRGYDSTDVRESVVEERWAFGGTWRIESESVIGGDAGLFASTDEPQGDAGAPDAAPVAPEGTRAPAAKRSFR